MKENKLITPEENKLITPEEFYLFVKKKLTVICNN
jgi:hypothetical protein